MPLSPCYPNGIKIELLLHVNLKRLCQICQQILEMVTYKTLTRTNIQTVLNYGFTKPKYRAKFGLNLWLNCYIFTICKTHTEDKHNYPIYPPGVYIFQKVLISSLPILPCASLNFFFLLSSSPILILTELFPYPKAGNLQEYTPLLSSSGFVWNHLPRVGIITWLNDVITSPANNRGYRGKLRKNWPSVYLTSLVCWVLELEIVGQRMFTRQGTPTCFSLIKRLYRR